MDILKEIDRVFNLEIATLTKLRSHLDASYSGAAKLILACSGKVVVSGIGKSGIIAHKISATMVSTGTPALYLDAGNGVHGDIGIVQSGDVLLALSKSGETDELLTLLPYIKNLGVPIISITSNNESRLARNSDCVLWTPIDEEACPLNLAPTSSTTAALVVGDALAMALMKARGFEPEHFALFHPGGQLGKRLLMKVSDTMRGGEDNPVVHKSDSVRHMLSEITNKRAGAVIVVDDSGKLAGLVTDFDIRQALERTEDIFSLQITDLMNPSPTHVFADEMAANALEVMEDREKPFLVLPVLDRQSEKVVGMVHVHDLLAKGL